MCMYIKKDFGFYTSLRPLRLKRPVGKAGQDKNIPLPGIRHIKRR